VDTNSRRPAPYASALVQLAALSVHEPRLDAVPKPSDGSCCPLRWLCALPPLSATAEQQHTAPGTSQLLEVLLRAEQGKGLEASELWSGAASSTDSTGNGCYGRVDTLRQWARNHRSPAQPHSAEPSASDTHLLVQARSVLDVGSDGASRRMEVVEAIGEREAAASSNSLATSSRFVSAVRAPELLKAVAGLAVLLAEDPAALLVELVAEVAERSGPALAHAVRCCIEVVYVVVATQAVVHSCDAASEDVTEAQSVEASVQEQAIALEWMYGEGLKALVMGDVRRRTRMVELCTPLLRRAAIIQVSFGIFQCRATLPCLRCLRASLSAAPRSLPTFAHFLPQALLRGEGTAPDLPWATDGLDAAEAALAQLAELLHLPSTAVAAGVLSGPLSSKFDDRHALLVRWCGHTTVASAVGAWRRQRIVLEMPSTTHLAFALPSPPELLPLPKLFQDLYLSWADRLCSSCGTSPNEPALCLVSKHPVGAAPQGSAHLPTMPRRLRYLGVPRCAYAPPLSLALGGQVCGELLCFAAECCKSDGQGECTRHAERCGAGIGIFLLVKATRMLLLRRQVCVATSRTVAAVCREGSTAKAVLFPNFTLCSMT
jgi:hypothetical protein